MVLCFLLDAVSELLGENYKNMSLYLMCQVPAGAAALQRDGVCLL